MARSPRGASTIYGEYTTCLNSSRKSYFQLATAGYPGLFAALSCSPRLPIEQRSNQRGRGISGGHLSFLIHITSPRSTIMTEPSPIATQQQDDMVTDASTEKQEDAAINVDVVEALPDIESGTPHSLESIKNVAEEPDASARQGEQEEKRESKRVKLNVDDALPEGNQEASKNDSGKVGDAAKQEEEEEEDYFDLRMMWAGQGFDFRVRASDRIYDFKVRPSTPLLSWLRYLSAFLVAGHHLLLDFRTGREAKDHRSRQGQDPGRRELLVRPPLISLNPLH